MAVLEKIRAKLNPIAAREAARTKKLTDALLDYRSGVKAESLGESSDPEVTGEAMSQLGFTEDIWESDVAVLRDAETLPCDAAYAAELGRLNRAVESFPTEKIELSKGFVAALMRRLRNPANSRVLDIPQNVKMMLEEESSNRYKLQMHIRLASTIRNFHRLNPRLFSTDLVLAANCSKPGVRFGKISEMENTTVDRGTSVCLGALDHPLQ